jgi:hypothetical protein
MLYGFAEHVIYRTFQSTFLFSWKSAFHHKEDKNWVLIQSVKDNICDRTAIGKGKFAWWEVKEFLLVTQYFGVTEEDWVRRELQNARQGNDTDILLKNLRPASVKHFQWLNKAVENFRSP